MIGAVKEEVSCCFNILTTVTHRGYTVLKVVPEFVDLPGCKEIYFSLKNLEAKAMESYEKGNKNKTIYIKGKKQLIEQTESAKFMTSKFVELRERKEKEKLIKKLKGEVSYFPEKPGKMEESIDAQQQYS